MLQGHSHKQSGEREKFAPLSIEFFFADLEDPTVGWVVFFVLLYVSYYRYRPKIETGH